MRTFLKYIFLAYAAASVQSTFFRWIKPDLVLVLVCFYAVKYGPFRGAAYGALTGVLLDVSSGFMLGPHIISKALAAYLTGIIRENVFQWNFIISAMVIAVFSLIDILVVYSCIEAFSKISFVNRSWTVSALEVVFTIAAGMVLHPLFHTEEKHRFLF